MVGASGLRRSRCGTAARAALVFVGCILFLFAAAVIPARGAVPIPMTTQGAAYDASGAPLPAGTPIRTFIDGVDYSNDSAVTGGAGSYSVLTAGNWVLNATTPEPSPTKHGANAGETTFYAASDFTASALVFQETLAWASDTVVMQDLHLGGLASTPQPLKIQGIVTQPARGGTPYVLLCNPTASAASLADYYLQRDAPGTYDGANFSLSGSLGAGAIVQENLSTIFGLVPTGDALKLVYRNPGGSSASAAGADIVVDRVEFNATIGGTLDWQPGSTIMGSAPAPGPGHILERSPSCADTNRPSDFHLAAEPGLPSATPPVVTITAPSPGQNVPGGQVFAIRWTMADDVFVNPYLHVWVNVTVNGVTTSLVAGGAGPTSADWNVPDVNAPGATVLVHVVDPFGAAGNATVRFNVIPATPYSVYVAILIVVVIAVFLLWAYRHARKEAEREQAKTKPLEAAASPPAAPAATPAASAPPEPGTKICPQCHTSVRAEDVTCFFCGYAFVRPP